MIHALSGQKGATGSGKELAEGMDEARLEAKGRATARQESTAGSPVKYRDVRDSLCLGACRACQGEEVSLVPHALLISALL